MVIIGYPVGGVAIVAKLLLSGPIVRNMVRKDYSSAPDTLGNAAAKNELDGEVAAACLTQPTPQEGDCMSGERPALLQSNGLFIERSSNDCERHYVIHNCLKLRRVQLRKSINHDE